MVFAGFLVGWLAGWLISLCVDVFVWVLDMRSCNDLWGSAGDTSWEEAWTRTFVDLPRSRPHERCCVM